MLHNNEFFNNNYWNVVIKILSLLSPFYHIQSHGIKCKSKGDGISPLDRPLWLLWPNIVQIFLNSRDSKSLFEG